jgi:CBS domain-containing protein
MSLGTLITRKPVALAPADTLAKAARLMQQENVGAIVITEFDRPVGIITDRDLALAAYVRRLSPDDALRTVMTYPVATVRDDDGVVEATRLMMEQAVRRLPVVDDSGRLVGLLSIDDVIPLLSRQLHNIAEGIQAEVAY